MSTVDQICAKMLKSLGDETRLAIFKLIYENEELCGTEIAEKLKLTQPNAVHHLTILKNSNLLVNHRKGQRVCYQINPDMLNKISGIDQLTVNLGCCQILFG